MTIKVTYNITDVYVTQDVSPVYINVSYSSGGGSGAAVWGGITGTLSDQTDLQTALDAKFDDPTGTSLQYIDGTGALQTFPLSLPVLQEVRNQTGATLDAGTVVYINGATGNKPTVTKAIATGDATSAQTLGMVSAAIANNGTGYVVVIGTCSGLDTSAFTEGQQLYLSYTTAGAVTTTKPYAPYHLVYIGIVTRAHPTLGTVEVRVQNGYELDEIHDVDALNPNNNDGIFYNSTTSLWEHKQISTALGYTPANAATTLTINGVTYDLSTSRTWTISAGISGSGASGQVAYWDGTTSQAGSNNLFWDNTNGRLGIGTNAPQRPLHIYSNSGMWVQSPTGGNAVLILTPTGFDTLNNSIIDFSINATSKAKLYSTGNLILQNGGTFTDSGQRLQVQGTTLLNGNVTFSSSTGMFWDATNSRLGIGTNAPDYAITVRRPANGLIASFGSTNQKGVTITENANGTGLITSNNYDVADPTTGISPSAVFGFNGSTSNFYGIGISAIRSTKYDIWFQTGATNGGGYRFYRGTTELMTLFTSGNLSLGSTTDTGERLQVTGTMKVTGASTFGGNMALTLNQNAPTTFTITNTNNNANAYAALELSTTSYASLFKHPTNRTYKFVLGNDLGFYNGASGDICILNDNTSGNIKFGSGGSSTAHMTIKSNGRINMSSLPTSSTGLATGDLWNDAGTLKIV